MEMDDGNLRRMIRGPNFFHHYTQPYLPHGVESLGNPSLVVRAGVVFLNRCKSLEPVEYDNRWKGTPFYWIGSAAFLARDYETAAFLYDASASEDMREVREGEHPPGRITPAIRFLLVQGDQADQAAQALSDNVTVGDCFLRRNGNSRSVRRYLLCRLSKRRDGIDGRADFFEQLAWRESVLQDS